MFILADKEMENMVSQFVTASYNKQFKDVYEALSYLMDSKKLDDKQKTRTKIGYKK